MMSNYCFCAPILPGGEEKMKKWDRDEIQGKGSAGHDKVFREAGITREQVWIQRTPMGDFAVASFEVEDAGKAFKTLANSTDPWAARFRDLLKQAHGFDLKRPLHVNELSIDWHVVEKIKA
jgi:hypothetical protein